MSILTKSRIDNISHDIQIAIQEIAEKHGVKLCMNGGTFCSTNATLKIKVATINDNGIVVTKERSTYIQAHKIYDLKREWLDQSFSHNGQLFTIIGLNTRAHRYPVVVKCDNGKTYKLSAKNVKNRMECNLR